MVTAKYPAPGHAPTPEQAEDLVRLFLAAHDMLEALEGVVRVADRKTTEFDAARAAILKAKRRRPCDASS